VGTGVEYTIVSLPFCCHVHMQDVCLDSSKVIPPFVMLWCTWHPILALYAPFSSLTTKYALTSSFTSVFTKSWYLEAQAGKTPTSHKNKIACYFQIKCRFCVVWLHSEEYLRLINMATFFSLLSFLKPYISNMWWCFTISYNMFACLNDSHEELRGSISLLCTMSKPVCYT